MICLFLAIVIAFLSATTPLLGHISIEPTKNIRKSDQRLSISDFHYTSDDDSLSLLINPNSLERELGFGISITNSASKHSRTTHTLTFTYNSYPLCNYGGVAHIWDSGKRLIIGRDPSQLFQDTTGERFRAWAPIDDVFRELTNKFDGAPQLKEKPEKCYVITKNKLIPVWKIKFTIDKMLYEVQMDLADIYSSSGIFFDVDGKASIYPNNHLDSSLQEFTLTGLVNNGTLENQYFITEIDSSSSESRATATDFNFTFDTSSSQFAETSIFTNVNRTFDWFRSIGYTSFGANKMTLMVHAVLNNSTNNALYQPSQTNPTIYIGDGDGKILQNLATDADVVTHEFGHHVIYDTITTTQGESLVLHEGLADFFTFAKSGDACLGESICPANSPIGCAVAEQCLRTADNSYTYGAADLPTEAHLRSQFISGMLWDLNSKDGIPLETVARLVLHGVGLLASNSGYHDLVLSLLYADSELTSSQHCDTIYARAQARGLSSVIADFGCSDSASSLPAIDGGSSGAEETSSSSSKKDRNPFCGIASTSKNGSKIPSLILLLPLALLPLRSMVND